MVRQFLLQPRSAAGVVGRSQNGALENECRRILQLSIRGPKWVYIRPKRNSSKPRLFPGARP